MRVEERADVLIDRWVDVRMNLKINMLICRWLKNYRLANGLMADRLMDFSADRLIVFC